MDIQDKNVGRAMPINSTLHQHICMAQFSFNFLIAICAKS